jgi:hypothetical protein
MGGLYMMQTKDSENFVVVNGTTYNEQTPQQVINWLETSRERGQRIRIFYGDTKTGRDWLEEYGTIGTVSRSTGSIKIPLLVANKRSIGGASILENNIVRITTKDSAGIIKDVYKHSEYHTPEFKIHDYGETFSVYADGRAHAAGFTSKEQAARYVCFMKGIRNSK